MKQNGSASLGEPGPFQLAPRGSAQIPLVLAMYILVVVMVVMVVMVVVGHDEDVDDGGDGERGKDGGGGGGACDEDVDDGHDGSRDKDGDDGGGDGARDEAGDARDTDAEVGTCDIDDGCARGKDGASCNTFGVSADGLDNGDGVVTSTASPLK